MRMSCDMHLKINLTASGVSRQHSWKSAQSESWWTFIKDPHRTRSGRYIIMITPATSQVYLGRTAQILGFPTASNSIDFTNSTSAFCGQKSSASVKEKIKRKLTARVLPMTRKNEVGLLQTTPDLVKTDLRQAVGFYPPALYPNDPRAAAWNTFGSSAVTIKKEFSPEPCKHSFTGTSTVSRSRTAKEPSAKRLKLAKTEPVQESCKLQSPISPEPRLMSDNVATMSLLSATECHLATLQDEDGDTPLHIAIAHGNVQLTELLIQLMSCLKLDIYNNLKQTPLHLAVITTHPQVVRKLVSAKANVNLPDRNGQTPAHLACQRAHIKCLEELMQSRIKLDLEAKNFEGFTPLHIAVFSGSVETVRYLIMNGANIDCKDGKSGRTPLHHAVEIGNQIIVQELVSLGANVNATSLSGNTALHTASGRGMSYMTKILLGAGADVTVHNSQHDSAVTVANSKELASTLKQAHGNKSKRRAIMVKDF